MIKRLSAQPSGLILLGNAKSRNYPGFTSAILNLTLIETLTGFLLDGRSVHTGVAIYTPTIRLDGRLGVNVRGDRCVLRALNARRAYRGRVLNTENIGKSVIRQ